MAKPWEQDFTAGADGAPSPAKKPWEQSFAAAPEPEAGIQAKDLGLALKKGVERIPGSLTGLADAVLGATTGADRPIGRLADLLGEVTGFQPSKMAQADEANHSPGYKAQKAQLDQAWDGSGANALSRLLLSPGEWDQVPEAWAKLDGKALAKAVAQNPGATAATAVESVPGMVAGGMIGRGAGMAAKVLAPSATGGVLGTLASEGLAGAALRAGIGEGAITAGQVMSNIDPTVDPQTAGLSSLAAGGVTGAIGGVSGRLAGQLGLPDLEMAMAGGAKGVNPLALAKRLPASMVQEGVLEELPQSMQEQVWQNLAEGKPLGEGVLRQGTEGMLAGMATAGAFNVLPRKGAGQPPVDPNVPRPDPALDAAIDADIRVAGAELANYQGLGGQKLLESLAMPMPAPEPGSLADAAQTAQQFGAAPTDPTAQLLKAYPTREAAQSELDGRPDADLLTIVSHPRGNSGFAVVRKGDQEVAQIELQKQREAESAATQGAATQAAQVRQAQLESEEDAARQDGQALKTIVDLNRSAAALEKSITEATAPADAANIRAQAAELRAEAKSVQEAAKATKASRAAEAGKALAQPPAGAADVTATAQVEDATQSELAPAPAQPVGELPGARAANQAKADAAGQAAQVRQAQLEAEEGGVPPSPPAQPVAAPAKKPSVQPPAGAAELATAAQAGEAALDELAPAGAQPVLSMPGVQAAQRAKAEAANASNLARQDQLASEEAATIEEAAAGTNTAPTAKQKETGNYEKGRFSVGGVTVAVENPVGSTRSGVENGKAWKTKMSAHYGEIDGTIGADGGPIDAYVKANTAATHDGPVFVVDQYDPNSGRFDEHKVLIGYGNAAEAAKAYDAHFGDKSGPKRRGAVTQMTMRGFKTWLSKADTTAPVSPTRFGGQAATDEQAAQDEIVASGGRFSRARGAVPQKSETADERLARKAAESNARKSSRQEKAKPPTQAGDVAAINKAAGVSDAEVVREMPSASNAKAGEISTQQADFISNIAKLFGKRVVFFRTPSIKHDGMWNQGDTIYLNSASSVMQLRVLGHELTHAMKVQAPEAYRRMLDAVSDLLTDEQLAAQHQDYFGVELADLAALDKPAAGTDGLSLREFLTEEWMADLSGNRFAEGSFWQDVFTAVADRHDGQAAKGIVGRLRMAIANAINKLMQVVRGGKYKVDERVGDRLDQVRAAVKDGFVAYEQATKDGQLSRKGEQNSHSVVKFAGSASRTRSVRDVTNDINAALVQLKAAEPASRASINRRIGQLQQERTALADDEYLRTRRAVDYGEMRASTRRGVNIEVAPDPRDEEAKSAFEALPEDGKKDVTYKVAERILPQLLRNMGVEGRIEYTIGGFAGGTAPSIIVHFDEATPYSAVKEFAVASGALLRQQAAISYDESSTGGNQTTFVAVRPNRELSYEEQQALFKEIYDRYPAAEGFTGRDGVMVFGNFGETPDAAFHAGIDKALSEISHSAEFSTDLRRFESDWHEPLNLEDTRYGQSDQSQNRGAVARGQGFFDALQAEADRLTRDAIAAAGRGAGYSGARARGSRAGDEGGADLAGSRDAEAGTGVPRQRSSGSAPEYGQPRGSAVSVPGFHYSKAQRPSLAGRLYGTGMRGEEARRLDRWSATQEQKHRVHYYVDEGHGVAPESDVGTHLHTTQLRNVYDRRADPLQLVVKARQRMKPGEDASDLNNYIEQLIMEEGFDGYYLSKAQGEQGVAVLLGSKHTDVPVAYLGQRGRIKNGEPLDVVDTPAPSPRPAAPTPAPPALATDGPDRLGPFSSENIAKFSKDFWQKKGVAYAVEQEDGQTWLRKVTPKFSAARGGGTLAIFEGLDGRGLKRARAEEALAAHPAADTLRYVEGHILDILDALETSGAVKINC